jgi:hypothetical protein
MKTTLMKNRILVHKLLVPVSFSYSQNKLNLWDMKLYSSENHNISENIYLKGQSHEKSLHKNGYQSITKPKLRTANTFIKFF